MISAELIPNLQTALEVEFIQEALFELVEDKYRFAPLLVVNHQDNFLSLSNKDHYLILMSVGSAEIIKEITEYSSYIFNRKKIFIQLEKHQETTEFQNYFHLKVSDIISRAKKNGINENNVYLLLLRDALQPLADSNS